MCCKGKVCCTLIGAILVALLAGCIYMGVFQYVMAYETVIASRMYVYKPFKMPYKNVGPEIEKALEFAQTLTEISSNPESKNYGYMGFYYDNPEWLINPNEARSEIGFYFYGNFSEQSIKRIDVFGYNHILLPELKVMQTHVPWRNPLSIFISIFKAYSPLISKLSAKEYKYVWDDENTPFIEFYEDSWYKVSFPLGDTKKAYYLTKEPIPNITEAGKNWIENVKKNNN